MKVDVDDETAASTAEVQVVEQFRTALSTRGENEVERSFLARWLGTRDAERVVAFACEVLTEVLSA